MPHIHPQIDFTVEVFVVYQDKVLLRLHDKYNIWLSVGGHIELDEDPIQAALREVKEEVGLDVVLEAGPNHIAENDDDYQELIPPAFLNRHRISETHEHVTLTYFATSHTDQVIAGGHDYSNQCRWFSPEEITQDPNIKPHIKRYALAALAAVGEPMSTPISQSQFINELSHILDETFENVHGIFLDRNTSLRETLSGLTAEEASRPISAKGTSIAAHIAHVIFYLDVLERSMRGEEIGKLDWEESWVTKQVTSDEWTSLQQSLMDHYQQLLTLMRSFDDWNIADRISEALAIVAHTAYHLGAIRQIIYVIK